jgi:3-oxoacyl-[acyl-carrier-protein] synthase II
VSEPLHITGVGVVSAFGDSRERFRDALLAGESGIRRDEGFAALGCRSTLAAKVDGFDAAKWISPMKLRRMDATGPFALVAVKQAMDEARYPATEAGDDRAGVVFGTYSAGGQATEGYLAALFRSGPTGAPALMFNSTVSNAATGLTGLEFKLRGPNATISQKEGSGLAAVATAVDLLRAGRADAIAAGGVDAAYEIFFRTHDRFGVMNRSEAFDESAAPFSRARAGFVMGEGGFALWLERGTSWRTRGARSYGEVLGVGASSAAVRLNAWPDRHQPLVRTMRLALDDAGLAPSDVDVVFAAANASPVLDAVEAAALSELFAGSSPVITSIKGALGESGAAGAAACVAAVACGAVGCVPPVAGLRALDPAAAGLNIARSATPAGPVVLLNSVASGGGLYSAVLRISR